MLAIFVGEELQAAFIEITQVGVLVGVLEQDIEKKVVTDFAVERMSQVLRSIEGIAVSEMYVEHAQAVGAFKLFAARTVASATSNIAAREPAFKTFVFMVSNHIGWTGDIVKGLRQSYKQMTGQQIQTFDNYPVTTAKAE